MTNAQCNENLKWKSSGPYHKNHAETANARNMLRSVKCAMSQWCTSKRVMHVNNNNNDNDNENETNISISLSLYSIHIYIYTII